MAGSTASAEALGTVYNVAFGGRTTLTALFGMIRARVAELRPEAARIEPRYLGFRPGDVRHSHADIGRARRLLGYAPRWSVESGLDRTTAWYAAQRRAPP